MEDVLQLVAVVMGGVVALVGGGWVAMRATTIRPDEDPFEHARGLLEGGSGGGMSAQGGWRGLDVTVRSGTAAHGAPAVVLEVQGDFGRIHVRERPLDRRRMGGGRREGFLQDLQDGDQKIGDIAFDERFVVTKTDLALVTEAIVRAALAVSGGTVAIEPTRVAVELSYGSMPEEDVHHGLNHLYGLAVALGLAEPTQEERVLDPREEPAVRAWNLYEIARHDPGAAAALGTRLRAGPEVPDAVVAAAADVMAVAHPDRDEPGVLEDLRRLVGHATVPVAVSAIHGLGYRGDVSDVATLRGRARGMLVDPRISKAVTDAVARLQAPVRDRVGGLAVTGDGGGLAVAARTVEHEGSGD